MVLHLNAGESKRVHVLLSGEKTMYHARDLMPDTSYTFRLSARTRHGPGNESVQTVTIGPHPGMCVCMGMCLTVRVYKGACVRLCVNRYLFGAFIGIFQ